MNIHPTTATNMNFNAIKTRQRAAWSSGDYAVVGTTLQIVGETLCEAVDLRSTERVLDVAAGNGNATLAAARRFADVVSTDYVDTLLVRAKERADADRLEATFMNADAENLPFADGSFDVVLSTFGVMFAPDHHRAAFEMVRVCRSGGRIGLANWTPESFIGQLFQVIGRHVPPPVGVSPPALWGTHGHVEALLGRDAAVTSQRRTFTFRYRSPAHWLEVFRGYYGPAMKAFAALDREGASSLEADILRLIESFNVADDGSAVIPGTYLEVVAMRR